MIQFTTEEDKARFLMEVGKSINEDATPDDHSRWVKHRKMIVPLLKDFRRSQQSKHQWRTGSVQMLFPMRKWHRGSEGRLFHRQLGRFLSTRDTGARNNLISTLHENVHTEPLSEAELRNVMRGIVSELGFYRSASDQADLELILESVEQVLARHVIGLPQ